jgi:hypothetical protein
MIALKLVNVCFASHLMPLANIQEQECLKKAKSLRIVCHSRSQRVHHQIDTFHRYCCPLDLIERRNYAVGAKLTEGESTTIRG